jgi:S1-C subfamily serine protease
MRTARISRTLLPLGLAAAALAAPGRAAADNLGRNFAILRAKPATVLILTEIGGQVRTRCGPAGPFQDVTVPAFEASGTGFIVNPDGWIITNGHVVQRYREHNDDEFRQGILRTAIGRACIATLEARQGRAFSRDERGALTERLMAAAQKDATVEATKSLTVFLPSGKGMPAEVKVFSPPIAPAPTEQEEAMAAALGRKEMAKGGRDVAVLKVAASGLPVVRLEDSDRVRVGDPVLIVGFPGVVLQHDLLSRATRTEASVTSGEISALRKDAQGRPVLQTDASVSWGNSGGPMVNARGDVVGIVTFISLADGGAGQAVQGFNFAVPANIAKEVARPAQIDFNAPSPFNALWDAALDDYNHGYVAAAVSKAEALARLAPDQSDVARFVSDAKALSASLPFYRRHPAWRWGAIGLVLAAGAVGTAAIVRQRGRRQTQEVKRVAREELLNLIRSAHVPGAVPAATAVSSGVTILDVRTDAATALRPQTIPGARRVAPDAVLEQCKTLPVSEHLVLFCD